MVRVTNTPNMCLTRQERRDHIFKRKATINNNTQQYIYIYIKKGFKFLKYDTLRTKYYYKHITYIFVRIFFLLFIIIVVLFYYKHRHIIILQIIYHTLNLAKEKAFKLLYIFSENKTLYIRTYIHINYHIVN